MPAQRAGRRNRFTCLSSLRRAACAMARKRLPELRSFARAFRRLPTKPRHPAKKVAAPTIETGLTSVFLRVLVLFYHRNEYEEGVMKGLVCAAVLSLMSIGAAFAQAPTAPAKLSADEKKAISKTCSDQANQKDLKGKDRRKFRAACIKNGGKS
jgi:hypothetical protein